MTGVSRLGIAGLAAACAVAGGREALAQAPSPAPSQVNPGLIQQQNQRNERELQNQSAPVAPGQLVIPPTRADAPVAAPGGPTVLLRKVVFEPSDFLKPATLDALAAGYVGKSVDISQIQTLVKSVNDLYAARGIITANAYLPPQNLNDGVLHIGLVEGKVGKVEVKGASRLKAGYLIARIDQPTGQVVEADQLADRLARFNRTGIAQVQASLQAGSQFGLTDVQLAVVEPPTNSLDLFVDNQGVASVGQYEGGALYQNYGPLGIDDRLTLYSLVAGGDASVNGSYSAPFDRSGGRIGASASYGAIRVIQGPYRSLGIQGASTTAAINGSQPLYIDQHWLVLVNASASYLDTTSKQSSVEVTDNTTAKGTAGLTLGYVANLGSINLASTFSRAHTTLAVTRSGQDFDLYDGTFSGLVHLPNRFDVLVDGAFQVSSAALLPGDQLFQIGGPTTVRGYSTNAVAGASGFYLNAEAHRDLSALAKGLSGFVFYDRGSVYNPKPSTTTLNAMGLGLSLALPRNISAEVTAGFPITHAFDKQPNCEIYFRLTARL